MKPKPMTLEGASYAQAVARGTGYPDAKLHHEKHNGVPTGKFIVVLGEYVDPVTNVRRYVRQIRGAEDGQTSAD